LSIDEHGTGPVEVYIALLARLGRYAEALEAAVELVPRGVRTSGFAPSMIELASSGGAYGRLLAVCRQRDDAVGYAAALVEQTHGKGI
jgi:hypothetical protein